MWTGGRLMLAKVISGVSKDLKQGAMWRWMEGGDREGRTTKGALRLARFTRVRVFMRANEVYFSHFRLL